MEYELIAATAMSVCAIVFMLTKDTPNSVHLVTLAMFPIAAYFGGMEWAEFGKHLLIGTLAFIIGLVLFAKANWIGGGNIKSLAVIAFWVPVKLYLIFLVFVILIWGTLYFTRNVENSFFIFLSKRYAASLFVVASTLLYFDNVSVILL